MGLSLFGRSGNDKYNKAVGAQQQAYNNASLSLQPYTQNAQQDFDTSRNALYQQGSQMMSQPNPNDLFTPYLSMTPQQMVSQAQSGYQMSPGAQNQMKLLESGAQNKLNYEGFYGSGEGNLQQAEIANAVQSQDMGKYMNSLGSALDKQLKMVGMADQQREGFMKNWQKMIDREYGASNTMAGNAMRTGDNISGIYKQQGANEANNPGLLQQGLSLAGAGLGLYDNHARTQAYVDQSNRYRPLF
jgi:hypothetical protein